MKASDGGMTMSMAMAAVVMVLPAALMAVAALLEVVEACTRKVNNAHCILTCVCLGL